VVVITLDSKDNKEEKTREVAEISMITSNGIFFNSDVWYAVVIVVDMKVFYTFNMCATIEARFFLVDNTLEGRNISEEKTRKGVDIGCITSVLIVFN